MFVTELFCPFKVSITNRVHIRVRQIMNRSGMKIPDYTGTDDPQVPFFILLTPKKLTLLDITQVPASNIVVTGIIVSQKQFIITDYFTVSFYININDFFSEMPEMRNSYHFLLIFSVTGSEPSG